MSKPNWVVVSQAVVVLSPLHIKHIGVGAKRMLRSSIELFILVFSVLICPSSASQWSRSTHQFWEPHPILQPTTKLPPTPASTSTSTSTPTPTPTHPPDRHTGGFDRKPQPFLPSYSSSSLASCGLSSWDMEVWATWLTWSASGRYEWCMLIATLIRRRDVSMASLSIFAYLTHHHRWIVAHEMGSERFFCVCWWWAHEGEFGYGVRLGKHRGSEARDRRNWASEWKLRPRGRLTQKPHWGYGGWIFWLTWIWVACGLWRCMWDWNLYACVGNGSEIVWEEMLSEDSCSRGGEREMPCCCLYEGSLLQHIGIISYEFGFCYILWILWQIWFWGSPRWALYGWNCVLCVNTWTIPFLEKFWVLHRVRL